MEATGAEGALEDLLGDGGGIIAHFDYTGNVGIGTTSPSYKLDVSGSLRATGESTFTNNLLFSDTSRIKLGTGQDLQIYQKIVILKILS